MSEAACASSRATRTSGIDVMSIAQVAQVGLSNNDDRAHEQGTAALAPQPYWTQTYRCACRGFAGSDCVEADQRATVHGKKRCPGWPSAPRTTVAAGVLSSATIVPSATFESFCGKPTSYPFPFFEARKSDIEAATIQWSWLDEMKRDEGDLPAPSGWKPHFAASDFTYNAGSSDPFNFATESYQSTTNFVLWTWTGVDHGADTFQAPGPLPNREGAFEDPEFVDTSLVPTSGPNASASSRRLRAGYEVSHRKLISEHSWFDPNLYCAAFNLKYMVHVRWPDEFIRWPDEFIRMPDDLLLGVSGSLIEQATLFHGEARTYSAVRLSPDVGWGLGRRRARRGGTRRGLKRACAFRGLPAIGASESALGRDRLRGAALGIAHANPNAAQCGRLLASNRGNDCRPDR